MHLKNEKGNEYIFTTMKLIYCVLLLLFGVVTIEGAKHELCDCFMYNKGNVCPGSSFQFESQGKHGYCESRGFDPVYHDCKCYNCDSCNLINQFDYKRKRRSIYYLN